MALLSAAAMPPRCSPLGKIASLFQFVRLALIFSISGIDSMRKAFNARLAAHRKPPKVICDMMRKLVHVAVGILKSGEMFDPALHGT